MAITLAQLAVGLRITADPTATLDAGVTAELTRVLAYATAVVQDRAPTAPDAYADEATLRIAGYLYDQPSAPGGTQWANAFRNSGAGSILAPYISRRAVAIGDGPESGPATQTPVEGTTANPVVNVAVEGDMLVVTFKDGTTASRAFDVSNRRDNTARQLARNAQDAADAAKALADTNAKAITDIQSDVGDNATAIASNLEAARAAQQAANAASDAALAAVNAFQAVPAPINLYRRTSVVMAAGSIGEGRIGYSPRAVAHVLGNIVAGGAIYGYHDTGSADFLTGLGLGLNKYTETSYFEQRTGGTADAPTYTILLHGGFLVPSAEAGAASLKYREVGAAEFVSLPLAKRRIGVNDYFGVSAARAEPYFVEGALYEIQFEVGGAATRLRVFDGSDGVQYGVSAARDAAARATWTLPARLMLNSNLYRLDALTEAISSLRTTVEALPTGGSRVAPQKVATLAIDAKAYAANALIDYDITAEENVPPGVSVVAGRRDSMNFNANVSISITGLKAGITRLLLIQKDGNAEVSALVQSWIDMAHPAAAGEGDQGDRVTWYWDWETNNPNPPLNFFVYRQIPPGEKRLDLGIMRSLGAGTVPANITIDVYVL